MTRGSLPSRAPAPSDAASLECTSGPKRAALAAPGSAPRRITRSVGDAPPAHIPIEPVTPPGRRAWRPQRAQQPLKSACCPLVLQALTLPTPLRPRRKCTPPKSLAPPHAPSCGTPLAPAERNAARAQRAAKAGRNVPGLATSPSAARCSAGLLPPACSCASRHTPARPSRSTRAAARGEARARAL